LFLRFYLGCDEYREVKFEVIRLQLKWRVVIHGRPWWSVLERISLLKHHWLGSCVMMFMQKRLIIGRTGKIA